MSKILVINGGRRIGRTLVERLSYAGMFVTQEDCDRAMMQIREAIVDSVADDLVPMSKPWLDDRPWLRAKKGRRSQR